jgi:hypothetical protein
VHAALGFVATVGAADVGRLAGTGDGSEGPIEHADDLAEVDLGRCPGEEIAAALALPTLQYAVVLEAEQDQLEELRRDLLLAGQVRDARARDRRVRAVP